MAFEMPLTSPPGWVTPFIGIPYKLGGESFDGCDCYGIIRLIGRKTGMISCDPVALSYASASDESVWDFVKDRIHIAREWVPVSHPNPFDLLMCQLGQNLHVALIVHGGWLIHAREDDQTVCERLSDWRNRRCHFYRHASRI